MAERSPVIAVAGVAALLAGIGVLALWPSPEPPASVPDPSPQTTPKAATEKAPQVQLALPERTATSPAAVPTTPELEQVRAILDKVVDVHATDPENPWAVGHALMVRGPDMVLSNGAKAVPYLFETYAQRQRIGSDVTVGFPRSRGNIRIEPHTDLLLKFFGEIGVAPDTTFMVEGEPMQMSQLVQHSMWRAWVDERGRTGFDSLGDAPWALQGLTTYAKDDVEWTAQGGHPMSLDLFTDVIVADLHAETRFIREAIDAGQTVQKQKQGIFAYTCGGAHLIQGAGYAVARGFGSLTARERMAEQVELLFWRIDVELGAVDQLLPKHPEYAHLLLDQRLKFLGHFLETTHKFAAMGLFEPTEAQRERMAFARDELVKTVLTIERSGIFEDLPAYRQQANTYQVYLDLVGDAAHALRGIALSTGEGTVTY